MSSSIRWAPWFMHPITVTQRSAFPASTTSTTSLNITAQFHARDLVPYDPSANLGTNAQPIFAQRQTHMVISFRDMMHSCVTKDRTTPEALPGVSCSPAGCFSAVTKLIGEASALKLVRRLRRFLNKATQPWDSRERVVVIRSE